MNLHPNKWGISVREIDFQWPGAEQLLFHNLSLELQGGETTCLIGPNGSGKTTLLELMLGWLKPSAGTLELANQPIQFMSSRERGRSMALVPQEERLPFAYSALEYVTLGRAPHLKPLAAPGKHDLEIAMDALDRVGISELSGRDVPRLSGGEKRLVLIARALAQKPKILLLDEPANHLDPANRERVLEILRGLRTMGITLVMSSHEPDVVTRLADKVVLLRSDLEPEIGAPHQMIVPERLEQLYGVRVRIVEAEGRRLILWGNDPS